MWKYLAQSVTGTSPLHSGLPCQHSCAARVVELADQPVLVLACSDGAGSAALSQFGSQLACQTLVDLVSGELRLYRAFDKVDRPRAQQWVHEVHQRLGAEADLREAELRQLACTLLFAVVGRQGAAFGQLGDGAIIIGRPEGYEHVFWPQSGEYINTTYFVTDARFADRLEFCWHDQPPDEVALLTDGLQMLALDYARQRVHSPFFAPMFVSLRAGDPAVLEGPMRSFLESPTLAERTDDDKTLVLATRMGT